MHYYEISCIEIIKCTFVIVKNQQQRHDYNKNALWPSDK